MLVWIPNLSHCKRKIYDLPTEKKKIIIIFVSKFQLPVGGGGAVLVLSELEGMATRQQREIAQQRRLLEQREARLAVLRGAQVSFFVF